MAQQPMNLRRTRISAEGFQHNRAKSPAAVMWDCGSSLYDSYELSTFTQHLQRAIAADGSASLVKDDGRGRSLSMPHFAFTPTSQFTDVKEDEPTPDVHFSSHSKIESLHRKMLSTTLGVPRFVQRLFTKSRTGAKQHGLHSKAGRAPFEGSSIQPFIIARNSHALNCSLSCCISFRTDFGHSLTKWQLVSASSVFWSCYSDFSASSALQSFH